MVCVCVCFNLLCLLVLYVQMRREQMEEFAQDTEVSCVN